MKIIDKTQNKYKNQNDHAKNNRKYFIKICRIISKNPLQISRSLEIILLS